MEEGTNQGTRRVLLTGATGFVGQRLYPALDERGYEVVCGSRDPESARRRYPDRRWAEVDVDRPHTVARALDEVEAAFYLIHQIKGGESYLERERKSARRFRDAAEAKELRRIVYLGGVEPKGGSSVHLQSRIETGRTLRGGSVSTVELRAAMIIGRGSASWRIVRDLAARLPAMILPEWTQTRSQPIWIGDVVNALVAALEHPARDSVYFNIPGPETMSVEEILGRTSKLLGHRPWTLRVPPLSPKLSSYWLRFITGADPALARELIEGLKYDLVVDDRLFWEEVEVPPLRSFDEAARAELEPPDEASTRAVERAIRAVSRGSGE